MTREEEIRKAAAEYRNDVLCDAALDVNLEYNRGMCDCIVEETPKAFIAGVDYTDSHPVKPKNKQTATIEAWVARDKSGDIYLWDTLPFRNLIKTCNYWEHLCGGSIKLSHDRFPTVTWKNSPKKVKVTIELCNESE